MSHLSIPIRMQKMRPSLFRMTTAMGVLALLLHIGGVAAQPIPGHVPTPTAASLARFGDTPVSLFTGSPDISIPIYTLQSGIDGLSMPISLVYDASGLQMNTLPSWTGYNWTLNVGGVISRQMYGLYDDFIFPQQSQINTNLRWFDIHGILPELMASSNRESAFENWNYLLDGSPDVFTFSFMGHSGKFFLGNDGQWKVQCDENLDVQFDVTSPQNYTYPPFTYPHAGLEPKTIFGFTIRDAEGVCYRFGYHSEAIEYTHSFFNMSHNENVYAWHASAWYLTSVSDKYGNELFSFDYSRGPYVIQAFNAYTVFDWEAHTEFGYFPSHSIDAYSQHFDNNFPYGFSISSPVYLTKAGNRAGVEVLFNSTYNQKKARHFYPRLYDYPNSTSQGVDELYQDLAKRVGLWVDEHPVVGDQAFFNAGAFHFLQDDSYRSYRDTTNTNVKDILGYSRLMQLNSITVRNSHSPDQRIVYDLTYDHQVKMHLVAVRAVSYANSHSFQEFAYKLFYNSFSTLPLDCLTRCTDHWGFYNGDTYNSYPDHSIGFSAYYGVRETDTTCCRRGMLREIVYPTGGATTIEYEPNSYSRYQNEERTGVVSLNASLPCGGVRVKSLTDWDGPERHVPARKRTYGYDIPSTGLSSGQLFSKPKYYWPNWMVRTSQGSWDSFTIFRTASTIPLSNSFGPHVGYSHVEVRDSCDGSRTAYRFSNLSDNLRDQGFDFTYLGNGSSSPLDMFTERGAFRGKLLHVCEYDGQGRKVKAVGYSYDSIDESFFTYRSNLTLFSPPTSASNYFIAGGVTRILHPKIKLVETRDTLFYGNSSSVTIHAKSYQNKNVRMFHPYEHYADIRILTSDSISRGPSSEKTTYEYPFFSPQTPSGYQMTRYFCLSPAAEALYRNGEFVTRHETSYKIVTWPIPHYDHPFTAYVPDRYTVTYHNGLTEDLVTYDTYDRGCRVVRYTRKGELPTYVTWGYHGAYPVLIGQGGGHVVNPYILESGAENSIDSIRSAIIHSNDPVTGYIYNPLYGVTEVVSPNGHVTHYRYDSMGRLSDIYDNEMRRTNHYEYGYGNKY